MQLPGGFFAKCVSFALFFVFDVVPMAIKAFFSRVTVWIPWVLIGVLFLTAPPRGFEWVGTIFVGLYVLSFILLLPSVFVGIIRRMKKQ